MTRPLYLDHNATAPPAPGVPEALAGALRDGWGNPSSTHARGRAARAALERARGEVARSLAAEPEEVVFTSGGSEADALAIRGVIEAKLAGSLVIGALEHPAVRQTALPASLRAGVPLAVAQVDACGRVTEQALADALSFCERPLVSIMFAQNETGVLNDVARLGRLVRERGGLFHVDAVQAYGKVPVDFRTLPCDLLTVSAHKIGGPPGAGALLVRGPLALAPFCGGGGQERGLRNGTEPSPALIAFGVAAVRVREVLLPRAAEIARRRDRFEAALAGEEGVRFLGREAARLPNTSAVLVRGVPGGAIAAACERRGLLVSAGSACHAAGHGVSPLASVLRLAPEWAAGLVRVSLGPETTDGEIDRAARIFAEVIRDARAGGG